MLILGRRIRGLASSSVCVPHLGHRRSSRDYQSIIFRTFSHVLWVFQNPLKRVAFFKSIDRRGKGGEGEHNTFYLCPSRHFNIQWRYGGYPMGKDIEPLDIPLLESTGQGRGRGRGEDSAYIGIRKEWEKFVTPTKSDLMSEQCFTISAHSIKNEIMKIFIELILQPSYA